jgi:DNA-binding NtrC family response regulator
MTARILVVDDDPAMVTLLRRHLEGEGWQVSTATGSAAALGALASNSFDVILTDVVIDERGGIEILRDAQRLQPRSRVILMTAFGTLENAIEAIRHGAYDYLTKPFKMAEATVAITRALDDQRLREENQRLRRDAEKQHGVENLIGRSKALVSVVEQVRAVAASDAAVLLLGESGTGKELVARAVHWTSPRADRPFVAINCAALPEGLLESELFGHARGAFTGATQRHAGLFVEAHGGTLFLDEIADMPLPLQAKLLRVLQDKVVRAVGGREDITVDFRVVSATNRDVASLLREGKFREDLYYRLAVIPIRVPALRERPDDIPLLIQHFLQRAATRLGRRIEGVDDEAMAWLGSHRWPGNVRELENIIERAVTLCSGPLITTSDLRTEFAAPAESEAGIQPSLEELERSYVQRVLQQAKGDKRLAARILGVSVRTLQRKYPGIGRPDDAS